VRLDGVGGPAAEPADGAFERLILERRGRAAVVAHQVVMVVGVRSHELVSGGAASDRDALQEPQIDEQAKRAIDARHAHSVASATEGGDELVGVQASAAAAECPDDRRTRPARAVPVFRKNR
jgi:hypothetical protein